MRLINPILLFVSHLCDELWLVSRCGKQAATAAGRNSINNIAKAAFSSNKTLQPTIDLNCCRRHWNRWRIFLDYIQLELILNSGAICRAYIFNRIHIELIGCPVFFSLFRFVGAHLKAILLLQICHDNWTLHSSC